MGVRANLLQSKYKRGWWRRNMLSNLEKKQQSINRQGCWAPFLGGFMGSQIFQVKLNLTHRSPSWRCLSVPDTESILDIYCHSTSNKHTFTLLCANLSLLILVRKHVKEYQLFQWIHQSLNTLPIKRHRYAYTDITREWSIFIIFHNVFKEFCFSEAIWIRIQIHFFFAQSYIFQSRSMNTDPQQTGSSFKNVSNCYSQFLHSST